MGYRHVDPNMMIYYDQWERHDSKSRYCTVSGGNELVDGLGFPIFRQTHANP